uniref:Uncharacterized protein n=1 Tax=Timema bartmani TaxID=61472 RepID=A0A7R9ES76_9NEOP|nr:unnamed protein product [Timema bartmani]
MEDEESTSEEDVEPKRWHDFIPARVNVAIMSFLACWINYMLRVNMTLAIVAMVPFKESAQSDPICGPRPTKSQYNTSREPPDNGPRYDWSNDIQYSILGSYFWGNVLTAFPGGLLSDMFGGTRVILYTTLLTGVATCFLPLFAQLHWGLVLASRFLIGFFGKRKFPAKQAFTSSWFWVLIISHTGSLAGLIFLQSLAPKYMNDVLGYNIREVSGMFHVTPYLARLLLGLVFSLVADWLLAKGKMTTWGIRRWFTIPSHLIPGLLLVSIGFTGCNPAFSVALMTLGLGMNGASVVTNLINQHDLAPNFAEREIVREKERHTNKERTKQRARERGMQTSVKIAPDNSPDNPKNNFRVKRIPDVIPGTLYGIMNTFGTLAGGLTPIMVNVITAKKSGLVEWRYVMCIIGFAYLLSGLQFMFLGTAKKQYWNNLEDQQLAGERSTGGPLDDTKPTEN